MISDDDEDDEDNKSYFDMSNINHVETNWNKKLWKHHSSDSEDNSFENKININHNKIDQIIPKGNKYLLTSNNNKHNHAQMTKRYMTIAHCLKTLTKFAYIISYFFIWIYGIKILSWTEKQYHVSFRIYIVIYSFLWVFSVISILFLITWLLAWTNTLTLSDNFTTSVYIFQYAILSWVYITNIPYSIGWILYSYKHKDFNLDFMVYLGVNGVVSVLFLTFLILKFKTKEEEDIESMLNEKRKSSENEI